MLYLPVLFGVGFQIIHPFYSLVTATKRFVASTVPLSTWISEYDMRQNNFQKYYY